MTNANVDLKDHKINGFLEDNYYRNNLNIF